MTNPIIQRNNVRTFGQGQIPLVFGNGFGCDQHVWRFLTPAFEANFRIVLFDYVGSGKSDIAAYSPECYSSLQAYAQDLLDVCEALDLQQAIFVGHSVSASIGILAAIANPVQFQRLILVAPSPCFINHEPDYVGGFELADIMGLLDMMEKNYLGWVQAMTPTIMKNPDQPEMTQELEGNFCSTDPDIACQFAKITFLADNRADLVRLTTPALILQCSDDSLAPLPVGQFMQRQIANSRLQVLAATGHCPHMSQPAEVAAAIMADLAQRGLI